MQAYAEGFEILHASDYELDIARSPTSGSRARSSAPGCSSWPSAPSSRRATTSRTIRGYVEDSGEGRWTVVRRDRQERARAGDHARRCCARFASRAGRVVRGQGQRRAAQPVRRPRRSRGASSVGVPWPQPHARVDARQRGRSRGRHEPARRGARAHCPSTRRRWSSSARTGDLAQAQAAAGDLQPRPRGRAAGALQPDRRLARRHPARRLPRAARASRSSSSRAAQPDEKVLDRRCSSASATWPARSTTTAAYDQLEQDRRRVRRGGGHRVQPRLLPRPRRRRSSR